MAKIDITNFFSGISFSDRIGKEGSFFIGKSVNLFNPSHYGYMCPGPESVLITNTISEVNAKSVIDDFNKKMYFADTAGRIMEVSTVTNLATFGTVFPHTVSPHGAHAGPAKITDLVIYNIGTDLDRLMYAWNDGVDGDIGAYNISAGSFDDDYMSTVPSGAGVLDRVQPHPMLQWGENGFLYIVDGGDIEAFDGKNSVFTENKLQLPLGYLAYALFDAGEFLGICARKIMVDYGTDYSGLFTGQNVVFFWDGTSPNFNRRIPIDDPVVKAAFNLNNELLLFTIDHNKKGVIKNFDGNRFNMIQVLENNVSGESSGHYPTSHGSVGFFRNSLLIGEKNHGNLFLYGSPEIGVPKSLSNPISFVSTSTQIGAPITGSAGIVYFTAWNGSVGSIRRADMTSVDSARMQYKSLYYEFPQRTRINYVKLYFKALASGQGDDVLLDLDYGDRQIHIGNISYAGDGVITSKKLTITPDNQICDNFRVFIRPDEGAGIKYGRIEVDYEILEKDI